MIMTTATRHYCVHRSNPDVPGIHTQGTGKPTRKRCGYCGGALVTEHGRYHLFEHRGDGRYRLADSLGDYATQGAADRRADALNRGEYLESYNSHHGVIVRWEVREDPAWRRELRDEDQCTCHAPPMRHDKWRIDDPAGDGKNRLITDFAIRTYGRAHIEKLLARVGCPPLPEQAWEVL